MEEATEAAKDKEDAGTLEFQNRPQQVPCICNNVYIDPYNIYVYVYTYMKMNMCIYMYMYIHTHILFG